jgi:hypothetical protein
MAGIPRRLQDSGHPIASVPLQQSLPARIAVLQCRMRVRQWADPIQPLVDGALLLYKAAADTVPQPSPTTKATCTPWMPAPNRLR